MVSVMKKIVIIISALLCICACEKQVITPTDFYVTIDKATKFKAGEPVRFKLNGEADYYMFFSGETGHEYRYKDRTLIDISDVESAQLALETWPDYTTVDRPCPVEFYVSKTFEGLASYEDIDANRAIMKAEVASGMDKWEKLDWTVGPINTKTMTYHDITKYLDHFCFAVHYYCPYKHPTQNKIWGQCSFNLSGSLKVTLKNLPDREFTFGEMDHSFVFMAEDEEGRPWEWTWKNYYYMYDYYYQSRQDEQRVEIRTHVPSAGLTDEDKKKLSHKNVGGLAFGWNQGDIRFVGAGPNENNFDVDTWVIYSPIKLNSIDRDTGEVVKNMENDLYEYTYTYNEPGTYIATFHGFNVSAEKRYDKTIEIPVIITD